MRVQPAAAPRRLDAFTTAIIGVIVANAVVLGLQTYPGIVADYGATLDWLNGSASPSSSSSSRSGSPPTAAGRRTSSAPAGTSSTSSYRRRVRARAARNSTLLRLARLARVVRVIRLLPDLRVLLVGVARSLPPLGSMALLTT